MGVKVDAAVAWARGIALDDSHGYSQAARYGPDYDCSSLVIAAFRQAGVPVGDAVTTYNMRSEFLRSGWRDVTASVSLGSGAGLIAGDVLLNDSAHTCLCIGGGQVVNARTSDGHPETGDQTGNEIRLQGYWNFPWNVVLRWPEDGSKGDSPLGSTVLRYGSKGRAVTALQACLNYYGAGLETDGDFGRLTGAAVLDFQSRSAIEADGIAGPETWRTLISGGE